MIIYTPKKFPDLPFKNNLIHPEFPAICLEPQNFLNAPNNAHFPNSILKPNEVYVNECVFEF